MSKLNDDELKTLCDEYRVNTANFDRILSKGIYKNNLKKKIIKAFNNYIENDKNKLFRASKLIKKEEN